MSYNIYCWRAATTVGGADEAAKRRIYISRFAQPSESMIRGTACGSYNIMEMIFTVILLFGEIRNIRRKCMGENQIKKYGEVFTGFPVLLSIS